MSRISKYQVLVFFAIFFNCTCVVGQNIVDTVAFISIDSNSLKKDITYHIEQKVDSLKSTGIKKIIHYFSYCDGWPKYMDTLGVYDIHFLLWENDSKFFIQKFVNLNGDIFKRPPPKLIYAQNVFKFISENYSSLRSEVILPFITKNVSDGMEFYSLLLATHENYTLIEIYFNEDQFQKSIKENDLKEFKGDDMINANYQYNSRTKLSKLVTIISEVIGPIGK